MPTPLDQSRYQVRFDWGSTGLARLAPGDVTVVIDVLVDTDTDADRIGAEASGAGSTVLRGGLRCAGALAEAVIAEQHRRQARTSVVVIACGAADAGGGTRFAVEDLLGAGAVIDALAARGIDHTSPEAAAACEAFRGLRPALRHLLTASGTGQTWAEAGRREDVLAAASVDADSSAQC